MRGNGDRQLDDMGRAERRGLAAGRVQILRMSTHHETVRIDDDRNRDVVPKKDRFERRAAQADDRGHAAVPRRDRVHRGSPAPHQPQRGRRIEGAGASPGRQFADAVARDNRAHRTCVIQSGPDGERSGAAEDLPGAIGEQLRLCGLPHEATRILPQLLRCGSEDGLARRAVGDQIEHLGMLARLTGTEDGDGTAHQLAAVSMSAAASVRALNTTLMIRVEPA